MEKKFKPNGTQNLRILICTPKNFVSFSPNSVSKKNINYYHWCKVVILEWCNDRKRQHHNLHRKIVSIVEDWKCSINKQLYAIALLRCSIKEHFPSISTLKRIKRMNPKSISPLLQYIYSIERMKQGPPKLK